MSRTEGAPLWNTYQGSDGRWFVIGLSQAERWWPHLIRALGVEHWEDDPRFATPEARAAHGPDLIARLTEFFAAKPRDHWVDLLSQHGLMSARVQDYEELRNDPQVLANRYLVDLEYPDEGRTVQMINHPVRFSAAPEVGVRGPAPQFGQHTEEVLLEFGYTWDQIAELRACGAVGPRD
jgi:crotonobetainyl-CoA:carnitine CoA-transferase CaiB-like acyl-CoA transferase